MMNLKIQSSCRLRQPLQEYLRKVIPESSLVAVVYLFGSFGQGRESEQSDIDLAFLFPDALYKADPFEVMGMAAMIAAQVGMHFDRETDLTILNAASIEMAYEVVTSGCCVYTRDIDRRIEYEAIIRGMYYDFRPFLKEVRSRCLARL
jgi:predicted nucleotidyltransferase